MIKDAKKKALTELEKLKKELQGRRMGLQDLEDHLLQLPLTHRIIYKSLENGVLQVYYGSMTLTFRAKSGIIEIDEKFDLWNEDGVGFIGTFTSKTLKMECSSGKELD